MIRVAKRADLALPSRPARLPALAHAVIVVVSSMFVTAACTNRDEPRAPSQADDGPSTPAVPREQQPQVVLGDEARVFVEVARNQRAIRRGLMYRSFMPTDAGMLFLFDREKIQSFWMKNTLISLDMIFIRADMTVAGVRANTPPRTLESQRVEVPSQFVLEVNAGWAAKNKVVAGAPVRFENIADVPAAAPRR